MGPNVKKLIVRKMAADMTAPGSGMPEVIKALTDGKLGERARKATRWVEAALAAVKSARDNPYGNDDESIAAEILRRIEKTKS